MFCKSSLAKQGKMGDRNRIYLYLSIYLIFHRPKTVDVHRYDFIYTYIYYKDEKHRWEQKIASKTIIRKDEILKTAKKM